MQIVVYEEKYQDQVVALWQECGLTVPWNNPVKDIQRKLAKDPHLFLVGLLDGVVVASVMGGYEGHRGWVNYLAVKPKLQKINFVCIACGRVAQLPSEVCNPRDLVLMAKQEPPEKIV